MIIDFILNYWLLIFWAFIIGPLLIIGAFKIVEEIQFQIEKRRYRNTTKINT